MPDILRRVKSLIPGSSHDPVPTSTTPEAPDGSNELLRSGVWPATQTIRVVGFPHELVLAGTDRDLHSRLKAPVTLARKKMGTQVVELLLEAGEDHSVSLSMRVPTAPNQFKDPYILMEAEQGNSSDVALREFHFHLQGRLSEQEIARADWKAFFASAVKKLQAFRTGKRKPASKSKKAPARKKARRS
jgi:hypothetical protein